MALEVIEIRDLKTFVDGFVDDVITFQVPSGSGQGTDPSSGFYLGQADGSTRGGDNVHGVYDFIRDRRIFSSVDVKEDPVTPGTDDLRRAIYAHDSLCRNTSIGFFRDMIDTYGTSTRFRLKAGQPNLQNGTQRFYTYNSSSASLQHIELNALTGNTENTDIWPNIADDFGDSTGVNTNADAGYWETNGDTDEWQVAIFEGITDTTDWEPNNTEVDEGILLGGSSHSKGLALLPASSVNFAGGGAGNAVSRRWIWVDLDTGLAVGTLGIPSVSSTNNTGDFAEPTIAGETFNWDVPQFVPDEGSTFSQPKGELHISTSFVSGKEVTDSVVAPEQTFTSTVVKNYVAVYDFNPFNVQSGVVRVHNRRIFVGELRTPHEPIIESGFSASNTDDGFSRRSGAIYYHPPSRSYFSISAHPPDANYTEADAPTIGHTRIIRWRRANNVSFLSSPVPTTEVTENRTVTAQVLAFNDISLPATSQQVTFTLTRKSTRAETFDGASLGSGTYTVEADVIDEDGSLDIRSGNDVDNAGTLLTEGGGNDYTVNYSTGVLTPVGSWPSDDIYVRYRHRSVGLTPAHGTLLNSAGTTDGNGVARAQVRYAGNINGELDGLEATA